MVISMVMGMLAATMGMAMEWAQWGMEMGRTMATTTPPLLQAGDAAYIQQQLQL